MSFIEVIIPFAIIAFLILLIWARVEHKEIMDILKDLRELLGGDKK